MGLVASVVERYGRTGRVGFNGPEYQLAKHGVDVMDQLAELTDLYTAASAALWSEARVRAIVKNCALQTKGAACPSM